MPYRAKYKNKLLDLDSQNISPMHNECAKIDRIIYEDYKFNNTLWQNLNDSTSFDIPNVIYTDEIDKIKNNLLYIQYTNIENVNCEYNKYITLKETHDFIDTARDEILNIIKYI